MIKGIGAQRALLVLLSLALLEGALRLALRVPSLQMLLWRRGPEGARIATICIARGHTDAQVSGGREIDAQLGWRNVIGSNEEWGPAAHSSAQHLRGTRTYALAKPSGVERIEVFGDSFAFGSEVGDDSTYPAMLEKTLPSSEVLDFGVPGYGLDQALLRFRAEGPAYHPDIVIIGMVSLLLPRDTMAFSYWYKPYFVLDGRGQLLLRGVPVPGLAEATREFDRGSRILDLLHLITTRPPPPDPHDPRDDALTSALLKAFVADIRAAGARPILAVYPFYQESAEGTPCSRLSREACAATGAECVDTSAAFAEAQARGVELKVRYHFSPAAHRIVADALARTLDETPTTPP
ncbi:MAG: SGNH/GDSL hydrolase family protein [Polyangiaceae bacterium]